MSRVTFLNLDEIYHQRGEEMELAQRRADWIMHELREIKEARGIERGVIVSQLHFNLKDERGMHWNL